MPTDSVPQTALDPTAAQAWTHLESRVEGVKTKSRFKFLGTGLFFGLSVFVAAFLGFSVADILFKLSVSTRVFALLATGAGVAGVFYWCVIRQWARLGGSLHVARNVESAFPQLEEQLSTALEYGQNSELRMRTSSPALVGALMKQAADRAEPLDFGRTIRWKPFVIAALMAFVLAAGFAAYAAKDRRLFGITFARFLQPTASIAAPTLTEIRSVTPGNDEVPVENSVPVAVALDGRLPETATLSVFIGDEKEGRWEDRVMDRDPADGLYKASLRRLLDTTKYKIKAGDTESTEFRIDVYKLPEITDFTLRVEHPAYTGKGTETLAPGVGDVRALKGTTVHVELKANTDLSKAKATFKSGGRETTATIDSTDKRKAALSFKVEKDDEYQFHVANAKNKTGTGSLYTIKALKDRAPRITIKRPEKDLMVHRSQTVNVEISADDDIGVGEIGIHHSLGLDETKVLVRRLEPASIRADGKLVWELGNMGLKGGEVVTYYAYALDNDTLGGPKMIKSDIHFLTVYDEEEYDSPQSPKKPQQGTPPAVKQIDKLVDVQKKLLKETFAQAQTRDTTKPNPLSDAEKSAAARTAEAQKKLRGQVADLLEKVKQEMAAAEAQPEAPEGEDPKAKGPGFSEKELKHMELAGEKMGAAEGQLKIPDTALAVRPETEALRHLSETRRLLLSDKEGDPRFKMAMDKQSKKKKKEEQNQQQQDQEQAKQELAEMPKMMDREKLIERELEELNARKKKNPPPPAGRPQTEEQKKEQDEQRKLQRELQQELEKLAKESEDRARKLDQLAQRNQDMQQAADKMQQAADKLEKAAEEAKKKAEQNTKEAQEKTKEAQNDTKDAQRSLRNAMEKQIRQELSNLEKDAQELAQRQQSLAEQAQQMQQQQDQKKSDPSQPQQGQKPEQGQKSEQGQPQPGQQGKPEQGKPEQSNPQGQPQEANQQGNPQQGQGKPEQGKPEQASGQGKESATPEQKMKGMAGEQRNIKNELKDLAERLEKVASRAEEKGLAGAKELEQAKQQATENSAANQSSQKAQDALQSAKGEEAQREAAKAAKAMEQMARTIQEAAQKTTAGDMKELAKAMKKVQGAAKEQSDINKDMARKGDNSQLGQRQEKVGEAAKEVADAAEKLETLRQQGRESSTKEKLDDAAKQADTAARALKSQDAAGAKMPAENAEKALNQALAEMERAAGKTLEEKARDAKSMAKTARENQEKAADSAKDIPATKPGEKLDEAGAAKRDEAAAKEHQAARDAKRLEHALDGLQEMARDANPAAADAAREARETTQQAELPKAMEELAKGIEKIGDPKKTAADKTAPNVTPKEAADKGNEMAKMIKELEKNLDAYIAEAQGSQLDRLRAMEQAARDAAKKAQQLAKQDGDQKPDQKQDPNQKGEQKSEQASKPGEQKGEQKSEQASKQPGDQKGEQKSESKQPGDKPGTQTAENGKPDPNAKPDPKSENKMPDDLGTPEQRVEAIKNLEKELKRLQPKLERLEPNAPELRLIKDAMAQGEKAKEASKNKPDPKSQPNAAGQNSGGPQFQKMSDSLDQVTAGLVNRIERILRAREVKPDEDEDAPKEYRVLVDKYYRALSEDVEDEKK